MRDFFYVYVVGLSLLAILIHIFVGYTKLHIDTQIVIYFTFVGVVLSVFFLEGSRKEFYQNIILYLIIGLILFHNYLQIYYIPVAILGLFFGYGLYKLGIGDLIEYPQKAYARKFNNMSLIWLILFWRCKLKTYNVYTHDGNSIKQAIVIVVGKSKEFFKIYFFDSDGIERVTLMKGASLRFLEEFVDKKLLVNPNMEIFLMGDANQNVVFSLMNLLFKNRFNRVGFLSYTSMNNILKSFKELKNDKENERRRVIKKFLQKDKK